MLKYAKTNEDERYSSQVSTYWAELGARAIRLARSFNLKIADGGGTSLSAASCFASFGGRERGYGKLIIDKQSMRLISRWYIYSSSIVDTNIIKNNLNLSRSVLNIIIPKPSNSGLVNNGLNHHFSIRNFHPHLPQCCTREKWILAPRIMRCDLVLRAIIRCRYLVLRAIWLDDLDPYIPSFSVQKGTTEETIT